MKEDVDTEDGWDAIQTLLTSAAKTVLGFSSHHQPDWFVDSMENIKPLLHHRNKAYVKWLGSGRQRDLTDFRKARGDTRCAVRRAGNLWFQGKAEEVVSKIWWQVSMEMYKGYAAGKKWFAAIHDEQGLPCTLSLHNISGGSATLLSEHFFCCRGI